MQRVLENELRTAMLERDGYRCVKCGANQNLQMSHVRRRSQCGRLKYDLNNVKTLCLRCHFNWHKCEAEAIAWFEATYPDRWKYLRRRIEQYRHAGHIPVTWYEDRLAAIRKGFPSHG